MEHPAVEEDTYLNTEALLFPTRTSLVGVSAVGWGGTIAHTVCSCGVDPHLRQEAWPTTQYAPLSYWPSWGGQAALEQEEGTDNKSLSEDEEASSRRRYCIVGSWDRWSSAHEMPWDGQAFAFTLEVGSSGRE